MIRFACPGCSSTFTVGDDKAGKTGKCPKCSSQFTIPLAEGAEAPAAEVATGGSVEIAPCPKCDARLTVDAGDLGLEVECPYCKTVYKAEKPGATKPKAGGSKPSLSDALSGGTSKRLRDEDDEDEAPRPSKRRRPVEDDEEEEERPSRRRKALLDDDDDDDRPVSKRRRRDEDDEDDEPRPSKRKKSKRRSNVKSKRVTAAILALVLGAFGVHKFYLGYTTAGIIYLLLICTGISSTLALIDAIIYLTKSDEDFIETYQVNQKEWF
jgi:TM2 domain-containing membrane protein YozV